MDKTSGKSGRHNLTGYLMMGPFILSFLLFTAYPLYFSLKLVFFKWNMGSAMEFAGIRYISQLIGDVTFWHALRNTAYFVLINVPLQIVVALLLAVMLNEKIFFRTFFRASYFFPVIISGAVTTLLWLWLLNKDVGIVNQMLHQCLGIPKIAWLSSEYLVIPSIALHATWKNVGFTVVILLAGLQSIPRSIYEAAELDGVTSLQKFFRITLPLLNPSIVMVLLLTTMGAFSLFIEPLVMTGNGGPGDASLSLYLYIYNKAFSFMRMNYASTLGFAVAIIVFVIVLIQKKVIEKEPYF